LELTSEQQAIVAHGAGPLRVQGGFGSGKTTALLARRERLGGRTLLLGRSEAAVAASGGMTFSQLAADVVARHERPIHVLADHEQQAFVAGMLSAEGQEQWPTLHEHLDDPAFAGEVATAVARYQASFLGLEELRTHAHAAGVAATWEELAQFTDRYLAALEEDEVADWGGILVRAAMLLRNPIALAAERDRWDHVLVDDYEAASFATNRLLSQLVGRGGDVVLAGNPAAPVGRTRGGTARWLTSFDRRFETTGDISLGGTFRQPAEEVSPDERIRLEGEAMLLNRATVELCAGCEWADVVLDERTWASGPPAEPTWFDLHLLGGPDVPDDATRRQRAEAEEAALLALGRSRATTRLVRITGS
jgi:superfamily I DNA/RNA helicase